MRRIISILVENEPGALSRIAGLFSARGYNIESLTVAPTDDDSLSRMTIVTHGSEQIIEQITKQLNKLINVLKIVELEEESSVQREIMLVKVKATLDTRSHILETVQLFRAKVVDVSNEAVTIEATGAHDKLEALLRVLEPFGVSELVKSGLVAVGRGSRSISERSLRSVERPA